MKVTDGYWSANGITVENWTSRQMIVILYFVTKQCLKGTFHTSSNRDGLVCFIESYEANA